MAHEVSTTLNKLAKDVYGDISTLYPDFTYLQKKIQFRESKKLGKEYVEAVKLSRSQGFTYGQGVQTLNGSIVSAQDDAKVRGAPIYLQEDIALDVAAALASAGPRAFIAGSKLITENMIESMSHRLEAQLIYGSKGLGTLSSVTNSVADDTAISLVFTAASWATGIWAGQENAKLEFANAGNTARIDSSSKPVVVEIDSIDAANRTLVCTIVPQTGQTLAALDDLIVAGLQVYFFGAFGNESVGLDTVCSTSSSSTLYNIASSGYSMWQATQKALSSSALTVKKIYATVGSAMGKGLMEDVVALVSPDAFLDLASAEIDTGSTGGRRYSSSSDAKNIKTGASSVVLTGPQGEIEVVPHPMVKTGDCMVFPIAKAERIGSTDVTFKVPGRGDEMFIQSTTQTSYELRLMSDQSLFLPCPSKCLKITGIVPTAIS
jgi:hypothetical protein